MSMRVVESPLLPLYPTDGENARRIVRQGLADVLLWLGENPGQLPGAPIRAFQVGDTLFVDADLYATLRRDNR
jgi:hypothetical protein